MVTRLCPVFARILAVPELQVYLDIYIYICILSGMKFEWDEDKATAVEGEHSVKFARIIDIFSDPYAVEFIDETHSMEEETRYAIVGLTAAYGLIYLVFTENEADGDLTLRFITARRPEKWMVDEYEENQRRN